MYRCILLKNSCIPCFVPITVVLFCILDHNILGARPKFLFHGYIAPKTLVNVPVHSSQTLGQYKQQANYFFSANWQRHLKALMPITVMPVWLRNTKGENYTPAFNFSYTQHKKGFRREKKKQFVAHWKESISFMQGLQAVCMYK